MAKGIVHKLYIGYQRYFAMDTLVSVKQIDKRDSPASGFTFDTIWNYTVGSVKLKSHRLEATDESSNFLGSV